MEQLSIAAHRFIWSHLAGLVGMRVYWRQLLSSFQRLLIVSAARRHTQRVVQPQAHYAKRQVELFRLVTRKQDRQRVIAKPIQGA